MFFLIIAENEDPCQGIRRNLSNEERWEIFSALLERSVNGNLKKKHYKRSFRSIFCTYSNGTKDLATSKRNG